MKSTFRFLILTSWITLLAASPARAMPAGEDGAPAADGAAAEEAFYEKVLETRRTAGERYRAMRKERLKKLNQNATRGVGHTDRVPGWKLEQTQQLAPVEEPSDTKGLYILLIVGAGVILSLALRVFAPFLYDRKPRAARVGEPMTVKLKPREERKFGRA